MAKNRPRTEQNQRQVIRIDVLPDNVLLGIFDLYVIMHPRSYTGKTEKEAWQTLVHVCQRWRSLVFRSPPRLDLRLVCTPRTPARDTLDVWPALPLIIKGNSMTLSSTDNVIAALKQSNRVCQVDLFNLVDWQLEDVLAVMQVPFPELTYLRLHLYDETLSVIPDSFLGGSAPRLRYLDLNGIPFPGLPNLLLSATHLAALCLNNIPHSEYFSPEAIIAPLSVLSSLKSLELEFQSNQSHPNWRGRSLPPQKPSILPALQKFRFEGLAEYLEELVTRIDTPQLVTLNIYFPNQIDFDYPRLAQFINCTPTLRALDKAYVRIDDWTSSVALLDLSRNLEIEILCQEPDRQLWSVAQLCNSCLPAPSTVEVLYIEHKYPLLVWENDYIENPSLWLELLHPFTAVKNLYLSREFAQGIAAALQEHVEGGITEMLPSLQNIFVDGPESLGPFWESIEHFVTARQLSGSPVAIFVKNDGEYEEQSMSCMHSTLTSIGREADIFVLRGEIADEIGEDFGHCRRVWSFLSISTNSQGISSKARGMPRAQMQRRSESTRV